MNPNQVQLIIAGCALRSCSGSDYKGWQAMPNYQHSGRAGSNKLVLDVWFRANKGKQLWKRLRPCSHHSFGTGTVPERNRVPVFTPVPLRPVIPERADHLAMWSQWNGSGTGPVGSVVWTRDWTRSGTVPVARNIRRYPAHSSYLQTFITSWHLATDRLISDRLIRVPLMIKYGKNARLP